MSLINILQDATDKNYGDAGNMADVSGFFDDGLGAMVQSLANVLAVIVVLIGLYQTGKAVVAGRGGSAVKSVIGTIVLAAIMFNLDLVLVLVEWMIAVVASVFDSFSGAFDSDT